jgi:hypothetical protein
MKNGMMLTGIVELAVDAGDETERLDTLLAEKVFEKLELCVGMEAEDMVTELEDYTHILEMTFEHDRLRAEHVKKGDPRRKSGKMEGSGGVSEGSQDR